MWLEMTVHDEAVAALGLLMALAKADGPLHSEEFEVLYAFLEALREAIGIEQSKEEDQGLLNELTGWVATAKSIQANGLALHEASQAKGIFPKFLAAMAVADGLPNDKERIMIGRIKAAIRSASANLS